MASFPSNTRILCADDMATMRRLVEQALSHLGYTDLTFAADGQEAWDRLAAEADTDRPFELVISDWMMPRMTGLELLRKVRGDARMKALPILFLTSESEMGHMLEAIKAGVNHYVTKPFTVEVLKTKMDQVFANLKRPSGS